MRYSKLKLLAATAFLVAVPAAIVWGQRAGWPPPAGAVATLCVYNAVPPTLNNGDVGYIQCDATGHIGGGGSGSGGSVTQGTIPWQVSGTGTAGTANTGVVTIQGIAGMTPLQVTSPGPSSSSSLGITPVVSAGNESGHILKNSPGNVYSVYATNSTATQGFLVLLNAIAVPADGVMAPLACVPLAPNGVASLNYAPGPPGVFSTGIVAVVTSATSCFTKTTGTLTAYISGSVQ